MKTTSNGIWFSVLVCTKIKDGGGHEGNSTHSFYFLGSSSVQLLKNPRAYFSQPSKPLSGAQLPDSPYHLRNSVSFL